MESGEIQQELWLSATGDTDSVNYYTIRTRYGPRILYMLSLPS